MDSDDFRVASEVMRQLLQISREHAVPVDALLQQEGITLTDLPAQPGFMSGKLVERIARLGIEHTPDPLAGLNASRWQITSIFGLAGFLVQTASTVGSLIDTLVRAEPLVGDAGLTRLRLEHDQAHLTWDCRFRDPLVRFHAADFILGCYAWGLNTAVSQPAQRILSAVHLFHPAPDDSSLVQRYIDIFDCPVYFDQPECMLVFPAEHLSLPLSGADPALHEILSAHADTLLAARNPQARFIDLARSRLYALWQQGEANRDQLAAALHVSERTLHRRLSEAGLSYRQLFDELRQQKARALLRDPAIPISTIADTIGFDEPASFSRWFQQQAGMKPSEFRRSLGENQDPENSSCK